MTTFKRAIPALAVLLAIATLPIYHVKVARKSDYTDFGVYYRAASRMHDQSWENVYTLSDGATPFRYPPVVLPLFRPFGEMPLPTAKIAWFYIQFVAFLGGFFLIFQSTRSLLHRRGKEREALWITSAALLFTLRFFLDSFTIGQVSSLMFLGFCLSLYGWVKRRAGLSGTGLFIPTILKIGPGFDYFLFLLSRRRFRFRSLLAPFLVFASLGALTAWLAGGWARFRALWPAWIEIVTNDSNYYDASHYGSQSLKSALLRLANSGWFSSETAATLWISLSVLTCAGILLFWILRKPRSLYSRALFYCLGLFPYLWCMPETFKYSLTTLALPAAILMSYGAFHDRRKKDRLARLALVFGFLTLSIAGKDLVGDTLFFGSQRLSLPFLATVLLGLAVWRQAWQESMPSKIGAYVLTLLPFGAAKSLDPWPNLPTREATLGASLLVPFSTDSGAPHLLKKHCEELLATLSPRITEGIELILIPFGDRVSEWHPAVKMARTLEKIHSSIRLLPAADLKGRSAALRSAFLASRGRAVFISHGEQPCDPGFFVEALPLLNQGYALVRANRRMKETRFRIPVRLLSLVYGRHRLGLLFNRLVRWTLPIRTTDTHSGTMALTRELATRAFALQTSPDFLFDLEIALTSAAQGWKEQDLPVTFFLAEEKGIRRMSYESLSILIGLPLLAWRYKKGFYSSAQSLSVGMAAITADDWGLSPSINEAILELAQRGIVRRVSMMSDCRYLEHRLEELRRVPGIELGLHFNLTYGKKYRSPASALLEWINPFADRNARTAYVRHELQSQLSRLDQVGVSPKYLDGHHHMHVLPGLIDSVADLIRGAGIRVIRLPYDPALWLSPRALLVILALMARPAFRRHGFTHTRFFYPSLRDLCDTGRFRARLRQSDGVEVIVHPATQNDQTLWEHPDPYADERVIEYRALRMLEMLT